MVTRKSATLTRKTAKQATLTLETGQELTVPVDELGENVSEGDLFVVQILPEAEAKFKAGELSRTLINQLISDVT